MSPDISNFVAPGKASVMYDGQFGSTGKGLAGAWIGEHNDINWCTTNASANAGHTSIIDGKPVVLFHIPSSFLTARENNYCRVFINKGAIIDLDILIKEVEDLGMNYDQIFVDPNAAVITPDDQEDERSRWSSQTKIASTQKGCGAALARKVERRGPNLGQYVQQIHKKVPFQLRPVSLNREMSEGRSVMVEVPQGFSLSLSASGFYPYTTSRDCTLQQGLSDAGIHPRFFHKSLSVCRTYPIRVGNITDPEKGHQLGFSGRGYPDQVETSWESLGLKPEVTTVTKRVRRVFTFSNQQYKDMLEYSRPDLVLLNFCNYIPNRPRLQALVDGMIMVHRQTDVKPLLFYGYGPKTDDISEYIR
jgi:adenylosuccinate synthase